MRRARIAFLVSHEGSAMRAIVEACWRGDLAATPVAVIGNNSRARGLVWAAARGIPTYHLSGATHPSAELLDEAILSVLHRRAAEVIFLSGYLKKVGPQVLDAYRGSILNIHPAVLPELGGQGMYGDRVHLAVLESGAESSGVRVHLIGADYDTGPDVVREIVPVSQGDTLDILRARINECERRLGVKAVKMILDGRRTPRVFGPQCSS